MTSLDLDTLRETTGVFITESDFQVIEMEYKDWLKFDGSSDNEINAEKFIIDWNRDQEVLGTYMTTSDGNIKYFCMDGTDENYSITTQELINQIDMNSYHLENACRRDWKIFKDIVEKNEINLQLLKNILNGEMLISHEQIYHLLCTLKANPEFSNQDFKQKLKENCKK